MTWQGRSPDLGNRRVGQVPERSPPTEPDGAAAIAVILSCRKRDGGAVRFHYPARSETVVMGKDRTGTILLVRGLAFEKKPSAVSRYRRMLRELPAIMGNPSPSILLRMKPRPWPGNGPRTAWPPYAHPHLPCADRRPRIQTVSSLDLVRTCPFLKSLPSGGPVKFSQGPGSGELGDGSVAALSETDAIGGR
jgi:hypothetical protein